MAEEYQVAEFLSRRQITPQIKAISGNARVLTPKGYVYIDQLDLSTSISIYTGKRWVRVEIRPISSNTEQELVDFVGGDLACTPAVKFLTNSGRYTTSGLVKYIDPNDNRSTQIMVRNRRKCGRISKMFQIIGLDKDNQTVLVEGIIVNLFNG